IKNVIWSQTQSKVFLNISIGGKKSTDDIVIAKKFLKINIHPHFYEIFFEHPICVEQSCCKLLESSIKFDLKKEKDEWWSNLGKTKKLSDNLGDGAIISNDTVKEIFDEYEKNIQEEQTLERKEQTTWKRNEIDKEIERQNQIRNKIEKIKSTLECHQITSSRIVDEAVEQVSTTSATSHPDKMKIILPVRPCGRIDVNFSSREFITPKRESQENAEREWCAKQHEIMINRIGFSDKDLSSDERDPIFLMKKGYEFLEKKNYLAAVSTFSFCLTKMSNDLPELYLGRARAQYALQNYKRCAEDCSDALERFKPEVQSNLMERIHCFWLRGHCLISLGLIEHGEREIQMAVHLDPHNFERNKRYFIDSN
ncbi:uncharacterized protein LOC116346464, partial [Contarinia nasturtii]|uniref:uncharacterized protein LOC116346464 n=1 Tax=Contarinia nasturtii TaxID=265458 RepID=UPI0012D3B10C